MSVNTSPPAVTPANVDGGFDNDQMAAILGLTEESAQDEASDRADAAVESAEDADETVESAEDADDETGEAESNEDSGEGDSEEEAEPTDKAKSESKASKLPFSAVDAEGNAIADDELAGLKITLKAAGKEESLTLADVVRRAASEAGAMAHARKLESKLAEVEKASKSIEEELNEIRQIARRAALDDEFRDALRESLEEYESPEAELARIKQERAEAEQRAKQEQEIREREEMAASFLTGTVLPAFDALLKNNPTLTYEELLGRFTSDTSDLLVDGKVPPQHYDKVEALLNGPLAAWAQKRHAERSKVSTKQREEAQRTKNRLARAAAPVARNAGKPSAGRPKSSGELTYEQAVARALSVFNEE